MEDKLLEKTEEKINEILENDINPNNLEHLDKLVDIYKDIKEVECMNYGNYGYGNYGEGYGNYGNYENYSGRGPGHGSYGEYNAGGYGEYGRGSYGRDSYGRRGRDSKYRGYEHLDRMADDYGRYTESRERYGAGEESDKSFHYMVKGLEDFIKVLHEEAETPQQKQELMQALQNSMR